jgi:hypothetical protein
MLGGFYARAIKSTRQVGAWERALHGPAGRKVLTMVLQHAAVEKDMLAASLMLIAEQAPYQRKVLTALRNETAALRTAGTLAAGDAAEILEDLAATERHLTALERRAASATPETRVLASKTVKTAAASTLARARPVTQTSILYTVLAASDQLNPALHARLTQAMGAGPLGQRAWIVLAEAIEAGLRPGAKGNLLYTVMQHFGELSAAAHPAYRRIIGETSGMITGMGLRPVEVLGESWLIKTVGAAEPKQFRDGLLLAVSEPAHGLERIGEAGIAVTLESRQASTLAEAGEYIEQYKATRRQSYDRAKAATSQQIRGGLRTETAIVEDMLLLTPDGELYRLRPMPTGLSTNVLARPLVLPRENLSTLTQAAATTSGRPGDVVQIPTAFSSEQLRAHAGGLIALVQRALEAI